MILHRLGHGNREEHFDNRRTRRLHQPQRNVDLIEIEYHPMIKLDPLQLNRPKPLRNPPPVLRLQHFDDPPRIARLFRNYPVPIPRTLNLEFLDRLKRVIESLRTPILDHRFQPNAQVRGNAGHPTRDQRIQNALVGPLPAIRDNHRGKRLIAPPIGPDALEDRAHHRALEQCLNVRHHSPYSV